MKKILLNLFAIILAVSMVFTMAPLSMERAYADDNTTTVDGVVYTLNDDRTATVSGLENTTQTTVTIPGFFFDDEGGFHSVTSIGEYAFQNCTNLTTITIPASVTSIGEGAFDTTQLTTVNFGGTKTQWDEITGVGQLMGVTVYCVFTGEGGVKYTPKADRTAAVSGYTDELEPVVEIPSSVTYENEDYSVTSLGNSAFTHCSALESITLPDGLESIGDYAFRWSGLTTITIPASVTSIGKEVFLGAANFTSVEFAEGSTITAIPLGMFRGCTKLGPVNIPANVTSIGNSAFRGCEGFTSITLPDKVTSIGEYAFYNCTNLATITIPESVTYIGKGAFENDQLLTAVNFGGSKSQWEAITGDGKPTGVTVKCMGFQGAKVELSATSFTYNGKAQKPSILKIDGNALAEGTDYTAAWSNASSKSVGTYSITVTGKGQYKDTAKATYQIVPKGTTLKKPKKAKKAVTVKWKKQKAKMPTARISGYQIQLATNNAFTMNTKTVNVKGYKKTSKKVKKLKGKTKYFVRVRTYMKTGGNTYYSPWSKAKSVKTK